MINYRKMAYKDWNKDSFINLQRQLEDEQRDPTTIRPIPQGPCPSRWVDSRWVDGPVSVPCADECGGEQKGIGSIATGETLLNGYTPAQGEILSFDWIKCDRCGQMQWS